MSLAASSENCCSHTSVHTASRPYLAPYVTRHVHTSYLITGVITQLTVMRVLPVLDGGGRHDVEKVVKRKRKVARRILREPRRILTFSPVRGRDNERECVWERERECVRESVCVRERERERECV